MIGSNHHRCQPDAVDTAGAIPIDASVASLAGHSSDASLSSFIFVPALDYVPTSNGSNSNRGEQSWNEKLLTFPETDLPRMK